MIEITDKSKCCGCSSCVQRCPKQCISMREDEQGFLYPIIDTLKCIDCSLCEKVCPMLNPSLAKEPLQVFAAKNKNEEQRLRSSSGGMFILLAQYIIKQGGVVFGARFDQKWEVEHCYAETIEELEPLMRSKYVQSNIGNTYKEAEQFLKQGRSVMFVGTSCQIAGLKRFLRKEYNNLLAIDFICHGVPSPGIWRKYLEEIKFSLSEAAGKNSVLSFSLKPMPVITGINFREKQNGGYGWKKFGFEVRIKLPSEGDKNSVLKSDIFYENIFMRGFLSNLYLRPSCYRCTAKNGASGSDLTIADFWGIQDYHPEFDDDKGTSLVFVHTDKGKSVIERLKTKIDVLESNMSEAIESNPSYTRSVSIPEKYSLFWKTFIKSESVFISVMATMKLSIKDRIKRKVKNRFAKVIKSDLNKY
ncbi:Coenzyme F420 hydrogenase/dehydrogenase, beta subunit C-terminal domain [uncultured Bacteroides sp.]|uniref:Coenzyme F420 hydrogenase/dehydrogenase, beta subunit C-terminal domain n=1 Tax=uncultured Bacteroides sp. TaxID=162156 RepID=UPI002598FA92|nr:Coenzyme F420 hydrogenase/dehydrogenase, beta subunit C-terminal domain [uncultured Bacteroides sp.]